MKLNRQWSVAMIVCILAVVGACIYFYSMSCRLLEFRNQLAAIQHDIYWDAQVTWIEDGDTITVTTEGQSRVLRLYLVDAPEKGEPYSRRATDYLRYRILNEIVQVQDVGRMNHGRLLAFVSFDGEMVNLALLREGLAYLAIYHPEEKAYRNQAETAVEEAQKNKRGVWR